MVSFETLRTFEMILAVSLTRLDSSLTSKDSLVDNLTIFEVECSIVRQTSIGLVGGPLPLGVRILLKK